MLNNYKILRSILVLSVLAIMTGCATTNDLMTKREAFPSLYDANKKPTSILVLPALNESAEAEASELYNVTISAPLTNAGYYAFPVEVVTDVLRKEGIEDVTSIMSLPGSAFKDGFGADAVLFVNIARWEKVYTVLSGGVHVDLEFKMVSTTTDETLWQYSVKQFIDTTGNSNSGGGLIGALISTAISTALTKEFTAATMANNVAMTALPVGKYNAKNGTDGEEKTVSLASKDFHKVKEAEQQQ